MNIIFLTLAYPDSESDSNLYSDLMDELASRGHDVIVYRPNECSVCGKLEIRFRHLVKLVSVPVGRITKAPFFIKAYNTLLFGWRYTQAVVRGKSIKADLLIYSTPPITLAMVVNMVKKKTGCRTYLLLKDIFPQNAVDLRIIKPKSIVWRYFRQLETKLYKISDKIGCMSPANVRYLLCHNPWINPACVEILPNSIKPSNQLDPSEIPTSFLDSYGIDIAKLKLIYGGNLGKPQGVDYILKSLKSIDDLENVCTVIVGSGTDFKKLERGIGLYSIKNVILIPFMKKQEYRKLLSFMDVGLIYLYKEFSIPNFPSRVLDYLDMSLPVLAATDESSDIKQEICEAGAGLWCRSDQTDEFIKHVVYFRDNQEARLKMGFHARQLVESRYNVEYSASKIIQFLR